MGILVVEDNFLVGEMIRLAVEDAWFDVVGPAPTVEEGIRLADSAALDGAVLDINLSGDRVFPLARSLRSKGVPFIFVSGDDRTVLPQDMSEARLISKPIFVKDLTQIATDSFADGKAVRAEAQAQRVRTLRERIATGERRIVTQKRRLERLQFQGHDRNTVQLAVDLLEQMQTSLQLLKDTLAIIEKAGPAGAAAAAITRPISDDIIDVHDPHSLAHWSEKLGTSPARLAELLLTHKPSARVIARALGLEKYEGPSRKSTVLS